ncbi:MAG: hypothetical protein JM58_07870 [Peptococcaceae bacterium BICA1-8]|nr:MAG: hypothetical protein JM58_07870 [Peptococcaceae bacterium BICA1-8]
MLGKNIGIDLGYGYVKVTDGQMAHVFPSTVGIGQKIRFKSLLTSFSKPTDNLAITVDNKKYFVGELAIKQSEVVSRSLGRNRIEDTSAKILLLAALALYADKEDQSFNVITGLPVDYYSNFRDDWSELMLGMHAVKIDNGQQEKSKIIKIEKLQIIPQPFGTLYDKILNDEGEIKDETFGELKLGIVDIGFKTSDFAVADSLEFIDKLSSSTDIAMSTAFNILTEKFREKYLINKESYQLDKVVETGILRVAGESINVEEHINEAFSIVTNKIATEINSIWEKRDLDRIILTGGGGEAISKYLLPKFGNMELIKGAQFANVRGYQKLCSNLFRSTYSFTDENYA